MKYPGWGAIAWMLALVVWAVALWPNSGVNPASRIALMASICDDLPNWPSFEISRTKYFTYDWAETPDHRFYSNKAPGPALLGAPFFCAIDRALIPRTVAGGVGDGSRNESKGASSIDSQRLRLRYVYDIGLSIIWQIIPWALSLVYLLRVVNSRYRLSVDQQFFLMTAATLATTVTLFFPVYFGHAFSAWLWLMTLACFIERKMVALGFLLGLSLLSDYAAAYAFPAVFIALMVDCRSAPGALATFAKHLAKVACGALIPALVWCVYHHQAFGSVFALPQKFQNPIFIDLASERTALWGVIRLVPNPRALCELLFGPSRGLLITQPWILLVAVYESAIRLKRGIKSFDTVWIFIVGSAVGYLVMNASFGAWHGGGTAGPRYLSPPLPLFAVLAALSWPRAPRWYRQLLSVLLTYSILFQVFAHATYFAVNPGPLFPMLLSIARENPKMFFLKMSGQVIYWSLFLILFRNIFLRKQKFSPTESKARAQ